MKVFIFPFLFLLSFQATAECEQDDLRCYSNEKDAEFYIANEFPRSKDSDTYLLLLTQNFECQGRLNNYGVEWVSKNLFPIATTQLPLNTTESWRPKSKIPRNDFFKFLEKPDGCFKR